jgi:pterin-4a-carbinolamine dehydratase
MNEQWQERNRPRRLERRYQFPDYPTLRDFLDRAAALSEREGFYPDMGFGRDYVNITIHSEDGAQELWAARRRFAEQLDGLQNAEATN